MHNLCSTGKKSCNLMLFYSTDTRKLSEHWNESLVEIRTHSTHVSCMKPRSLVRRYCLLKLRYPSGAGGDVGIAPSTCRSPDPAADRERLCRTCKRSPSSMSVRGCDRHRQRGKKGELGPTLKQRPITPRRQASLTKPTYYPLTN